MSCQLFVLKWRLARIDLLRDLSVDLPPDIVAAMPIYEFVCHACQGNSEILVRSTEWKGTKCPRCGSTKLEKKLSAFASTTGDRDGVPNCSGVPSSCGKCGTGRPHSH